MKWGAAISGLFLAAGSSVGAADYAGETFGDWAVSGTGDVFIASVGNSAGSRFGTVCDADSCVPFFNPQIPCEDGASYPALVNAPAAAFSTSLKCKKIDKLDIYTLPLEGGVANAMSVGGVIGFALPMQSGEFKVARFSLTGAARASARASQLAKWAVSSEKKRQNASDDFSL